MLTHQASGGPGRKKRSKNEAAEGRKGIGLVTIKSIPAK